MSCQALSQSCPTLNTFYSPSKKKLSAVVALATLVAGVVLIGIGAYYLKGSGVIASVSAGGLSLLGFGASSLYFIILSCKKTTKPATHKAKSTQTKVAKNAPEQKEPTKSDNSTTQIGQVKVVKKATKEKKTKKSNIPRVQENQAKSSKSESPTEVPFPPPSPKEIKGTQAEVAKSGHKQQEPTKAKSFKVQENQAKSDKSESPAEVSSTHEVTEPETLEVDKYVDLIKAELSEVKNNPLQGWTLDKLVTLDFQKLRGEFYQTDLGKPLIANTQSVHLVDKMGALEIKALDYLVTTGTIQKYTKIDYDIEQQKCSDAHCYTIQVKLDTPSLKQEMLNFVIENLKKEIRDAEKIILDFSKMEEMRLALCKELSVKDLDHKTFLPYLYHANKVLTEEELLIESSSYNAKSLELEIKCQWYTYL